MSSEQYFEMCKELGNEPDESEVPVDIDDLPECVQTALSMYNTLSDEWDYMGGNYIGKNLTNLFEIFTLFNVAEDEQLISYKFLTIIDNERRALIRSKSKT